jgi:hypothetical protein
MGYNPTGLIFVLIIIKATHVNIMPSFEHGSEVQGSGSVKVNKRKATPSL